MGFGLAVDLFNVKLCMSRKKLKAKWTHRATGDGDL